MVRPVSSGRIHTRDDVIIKRGKPHKHMADILEARRVVFNSKVRSKALEGTEGPSAIVGDLLKSMEPEEVSFFISRHLFSQQSV